MKDENQATYTLLTLIAHLFVIKLRRQFSVKPHSPGPVPFIEQPVSLDEYLRAAEKLENKEEIDRPDIKAYPEKAQQIMTIGLILKLISPLIIKFGTVLSEIDFQLKNIADAFASHSRSTLMSLSAKNGNFSPAIG